MISTTVATSQGAQRSSQAGVDLRIVQRFGHRNLRDFGHGRVLLR